MPGTTPLAYRSAPTALAINMHLYWTGVAVDLYRAGDTSLQWLLEEAAAGEIFAAGHGEAGNDLPSLYSSARADRTDGGYRFTGRKMFGSLSPVWTRFGIHAMDLADSSAPKVVHAFIRRDTPGFEIKDNWDTLGMRGAPTCSPRPNVHVSASPSAPGVLQVTVSVSGTNVSLQSVQFNTPVNGLITGGGLVDSAGNTTLSLSGTAFTFTVRRVTAGAATTVPFVITDSCGAWPTFVGGGPSAF